MVNQKTINQEYLNDLNKKVDNAWKEWELTCNLRKQYVIDNCGYSVNQLVNHFKWGIVKIVEIDTIGYLAVIKITVCEKKLDGEWSKKTKVVYDPDQQVSV